MNIDVATIADFEKPNSNFELLNNATFDEFIGKSNFSLVFVYATWDGNSKKVLKELEKMADHIDKTKVDLGKIDGYTYESLQGRFDIQYFPQVFFFKKGELVFRYGGYRKSAKEFEELVTKYEFAIKRDTSYSRETIAFLYIHSFSYLYFHCQILS